MFKKFFSVSEHIINLVLIFLMVILVISVMLQVWTRYVTQRPLAWTEEVSRYVFIWISMLGGAIAVRDKSHLSIDDLVNKLPQIQRKIVGLGVNLIIAVFFIIMINSGFILHTVTSDQPSVILRIPMSIMYISAPIGAFISLLFLLDNSYDDIKGIIKRRQQ